MKIHLVYLTLWSVSQAAYISRMAVNRMRVPTAFRPGVTLHRPWTHRILPAASQRMPYVIYRNPPNRYVMKHFGPNANRNVFVSNGPWKTTARLPTLSAVTPEYEFIRAASAQPAVRVNGDTGFQSAYVYGGRGIRLGRYAVNCAVLACRPFRKRYFEVERRG
ncbi:hypothetical protein MSG28_002651 [Choristoneura fumiferana]|uniref:Uncharacterized protein n=1 Tax=Choristoneura fumiferana TaxID=7141 RepID=A0ACC0JIQ4_CHOFU|nr:hypothetical protein MSG28_002651 [Choristoneura fumiferana]